MYDVLAYLLFILMYFNYYYIKIKYLIKNIYLFIIIISLVILFHFCFIAGTQIYPIFLSLVIYFCAFVLKKYLPLLGVVDHPFLSSNVCFHI